MTQAPTHSRSSTPPGSGRRDRTRVAEQTSAKPGVQVSGLRRGFGGASPAWGRAVGMLIVVIGCALGAAWLVSSSGEKTDVLAVRAPVEVGQVLQRSDLTTASVAGTVDSIPVTDAATVIGQTVTTRLVPGQLVVPGMVTEQPVPGPGQSLVGLALQPAQVPSEGLRVGDEVMVLATAAGDPSQEQLGEPEILVDATVYSVGGPGAAGGQRLVTVVVPEPDAARVASHAAAQRVAVVETAPATMGGG